MRFPNEEEASGFTFATFQELQQAVIDLAVQVKRGRIFSVSPEEDPKADYDEPEIINEEP